MFIARNEQCFSGNAITLEHAFEKINMFHRIENEKYNNSLKGHISER